MKRFRLCMVVLSVMTMVGSILAGEDKAGPNLRLELDLVDGSHIIGVPSIESMPVQTSYANMDIPLKEISTVRMDADHETASLDLRNGDKLKGVINLKPIDLETIFGKVSVGIEHIKEIVSDTSLSGRRPLKEITRAMSGGDRDESGIVLRSHRGTRGEPTTSKESYPVPIEIQYVCRTDTTDLRLAYACEQMIFNWSNNLDELRIDGGPAKDQHRLGAGRIPVSKFVTIRQVVNKDKMEVFVDDELRASWQGDFSKVNSPIAVFSACGAMVTLKSVHVRQL